MEQYTTSLIEHGFDSIARLRHVNDEALIRAGVHLSAHRKLITSHIPSALAMDNAAAMDSDSIYGNAVVAEMHEENIRGKPHVFSIFLNNSTLYYSFLA